MLSTVYLLVLAAFSDNLLLLNQLVIEMRSESARSRASVGEFADYKNVQSSAYMTAF